MLVPGRLNCFLISLMYGQVFYFIMEDVQFSVNAYFLDNDFTEDFLKGCLYDVPGESEALKYYALDTLI